MRPELKSLYDRVDNITVYAEVADRSFYEIRRTLREIIEHLDRALPLYVEPD